MAHTPNKTIPALRLLRRSHGFTLIELMVALVLSATLVSALYQFFSRTSESMYEADSMAGTTDQARFALELLSRDVQSAGAFASPDSATDPWMNTTQARLRTVRVRAFMKPAAQQDVVLPNSIHDTAFAQNSHTIGAGGGTGGDQVISTDSLILVGAFDFPLSFQIDNVQNVGADGMTVRIPMHGRGVMRLLTPDPFNTTVPTRAGFAIPAPFQNYLAGQGIDRWRGRLLRVVDRQGYFQFATVNARPAFDDNIGITLTLGGPSGAYLMPRQNNELMGLAPSTNDGTADVGYDAAFVDVFRYRLCVDPADRSNLRLVRERLNAGAVVNNNPTVDMPSDCGTLNANIIEQVPVLEHAVDFQVWFDCNQATDITAANSQNKWDNYAGSWVRSDAAVVANPQHNCTITEAGGAAQAGQAARARFAHLRVSVRTDSERRDVGNYMFLDAGGNRVGSLQTVDLDNDPTTSARVVTFQTDIELPNANYRTARAPVIP